MRADKRSFSFTWMRGQKNTDTSGCTAPTNASAASLSERPNASWYMTTASSTSSSSGVSSMSESSSITSTNTGSSDDVGKENSSFSRNDTSKSRLRRLGSSFTRFGTKYSIIEDDDETQNSAPLEFENNVTMETEEQSVEVSMPEPAPAKEPVHFDEDGNFIGRPGKSCSSRRKSTASGKEMVSMTGTSSSLGKKINRTVQEVKASIGNFSQKFRRSTRRRYRMGPGTPLTEVTPTRRILGRTPTKLYSPFGIGFDSPAMKTPKRLDRPSTPRLTRRSMVSGLVYSPANNFGNDLADARRGMEDFQILTRDITRRSVRF